VDHAVPGGDLRRGITKGDLLQANSARRPVTGRRDGAYRVE
jgi:hypothetical protein